MKKPKISLDKDKLQQFFLLHIEKILLVIVVGLMGLLIYRGFSLAPLDSTLSPQALVSQSNQAKQYIDDPGRWINEVSAKRTPEFNIVKGVGEVQKHSDPLAYMLVNTWSRPDFPKLSPREDPILFPPEKLIVRPVIGALASFARNENEWVDPLYPPETEEEAAKRKAKEKRDAAKAKKAATELGGEMLGGGEGGGVGRPTRGRRGNMAGGGEEGGGEMSPGGMGGMMGGGYGGQMPTDRYADSMTYGFIPQSPEQTITRNMASVTIMAVVPIQKQTEEFEKKLAQSLDYDPNRDIPYYMEFRVQRADVTDLAPDADPATFKWQSLAPPARALAEYYGDERTPGLYAGIPMEVCDPSYLSEVLTHPAPPYLQRDLWDLLTHPDVPLASVNLAYADGAVPGAGTPTTPGDEDAPSAPILGPGMGGFPGGGGEGGMGGGLGGMGGGMRPGMNRMPGGGGEGGMMGGGMMGGGMRPGGGMMGGGMMGGGMRPGGFGGMRGGEESGMGGYGAGMPIYTPPKFQLIRFTDKEVTPGRKYRYRFNVWLHDPNHPAATILPPSLASLHENVRKRIKELDTADAARPKNKQTNQPFRTYWLVSPWSEPSPVAEVPRGERVYAGKVTPRAPTRIKSVDVAAEPVGTALAVVFDPSIRADVPGETNVGRGSVLNFPVDGNAQKPGTKLIHPVTKDIVDKEKYIFTTNAMVADLSGGEPIKPVVTGSGAQTLSALGEMLVVDGDGRLRVQNEADDIYQYRRFTVPKPDPKAKVAPQDGLGMPGGGDMPLPGRRGGSP
jgi:hypothetical protein